MTDIRYKKLIRIFSVFAGIAALSSLLPGPLFDVLFPAFPYYDWVIAISAWLNIIAFLLLFSLMSTRVELTAKLEKRTWLFLLFLLVPLIPGVIFEIIPLLIVPGTLMLLLLGIIVFFSPERSKRRIILLLSLMVLSFLLKRYHLPFSGFILVTSLGVFAAGSLIHGIHILLANKDNLYLRVVGSFCSFLITIGLLAILFKFQHWPLGGLLIHMTIVPVLVTTLFILIILPGSGFINWGKKQKQILTIKILFPWSFLLIYMALRLLLPIPVQQRIFEKDVGKIESFYMYPYEIEMKDGMEEGE